MRCFCSIGKFSCSKTQHWLAHISLCAMKTKGEVRLAGFLQIEMQLHSLDQEAGKNTRAREDVEKRLHTCTRSMRVRSKTAFVEGIVVRASNASNVCALSFSKMGIERF